MPRIPLLVILALALLAGCGKTATEPGGSTPGALPPALVATQPAPRATGVLYDGEIWGQFDRSIDPSSVGPKSVFLKLDGQRIPVDVSYESITRRILVDPTVTLDLQRTYTVEFTPAVLAADGTPLPPGVFFQFTTNSLRRLVYDYPVGGVLEGPLTSLGWGGSLGPANDLFYEVYAGTDSALVDQRAMAPLQRSVFTRFVPGQWWPQGQKVYWAITSENFATKERLPGPVQSFTVLDAALPVDSVTVFARDFGSNDIRNRNTQFCNNSRLPCGPGFNGGIHWDYARLPSGVRVVGATLSCFLIDAEAGAFPRIQPVTTWLSQNDWSSCAMIAPGPPYQETSGLLATAVEATPTRLDFTGERLGAFVEAQARNRTLVPGLVIRSAANLNFHSPVALPPGLPPRITVRFQRMPAGLDR